MKAKPAKGIGLRFVFFVSGDRMPQLFQMDTDLVFPSGVDIYLEQRIVGRLFEHPVMGHRFFSRRFLVRRRQGDCPVSKR